MICATLLMALREIRRNTLRSVLTMLGIVIGVGAVIALVTIGEGATARVKADIAKLGDNLLMVSPGGGRAVRRRRPRRRRASPAPTRRRFAARSPAPSAWRRPRPSRFRSFPAIATRRPRPSAPRRRISRSAPTPCPRGACSRKPRRRSGRPLCVLGATVARLCSARPIRSGPRSACDKLSCEVVGLLAAKGQSGMGQDQDDVVLYAAACAAAAHRRQRRRQCHLRVSAQNAQATTRVRRGSSRCCASGAGIGPEVDDDFSVRDMEEIAANHERAPPAR